MYKYKKIHGYKVRVFPVDKEYKYQALVYSARIGRYQYVNVFGNTVEECYKNFKVAIDNILYGDCDLSSVFYD